MINIEKSNEHFAVPAHPTMDASFRPYTPAPVREQARRPLQAIAIGQKVTKQMVLASKPMKPTTRKRKLDEAKDTAEDGETKGDSKPQNWTDEERTKLLTYLFNDDENFKLLQSNRKRMLGRVSCR